MNQARPGNRQHFQTVALSWRSAHRGQGIQEQPGDAVVRLAALLPLGITLAAADESCRRRSTDRLHGLIARCSTVRDPILGPLAGDGPLGSGYGGLGRRDDRHNALILAAVLLQVSQRCDWPRGWEAGGTGVLHIR